MVTVPMYDQPTQSLGGGGFTPLQAPEVKNYTGQQIEEFGKAMSTATDVATKIAVDIQNKYDDARTKELFNAAAGEVDKLRAEYQTLSGKNAVDAYGAYQNKINSVINSYKDKAENPVQTRMYNDASSTLARSTLSQINSHQLQQLHQFDVNESKTKMDGSVKQATTAFLTGQNQDVWMQALNNDINTYAELNGVPKDSEQAKALRSEKYDAVVQGAVKSALASGKPSQAEELLKEATLSGNLTEEMHTELQALVGQQSDRAKALTLSYSLKGGESAQLAEAKSMFVNDKITQPQHDYLVSYIKSKFADINSAREQDTKNVSIQAINWIASNIGKNPADMPVSLISGIQRTGLALQVRQWATTAEKPIDQLEEMKNRGRLLQLSPTEFLKLDHDTAFTQENISFSTMKEMQNIAADMRLGKGDYAYGFDPKILQDAIPPALLTTGNKDKKDAFIAFQAQAVLDWKKQHPGQFPTPEQQRQVAASANADWVVKSYDFWGRKEGKVVPAYQVPANAVALPIKVSQARVPVDYYQEGKSMGYTDDQIINIFNKTQGKK